MAQYNLGLSYRLGSGVPEDPVMAYAWINLAGSNGKDVSEAKRVIEEKLSPEGISEAHGLTRQLKKDYPDIY